MKSRLKLKQRNDHRSIFRIPFTSTVVENWHDGFRTLEQLEPNSGLSKVVSPANLERSGSCLPSDARLVTIHPLGTLEGIVPEEDRLVRLEG